MKSIKKKAVLINQGYSDNLGDKAIALNMKKTLESMNYDVTFCGFSQCENQNISTMNVYKKNKFKECMRNYIPSSLVFLFFKIRKIIKEYNSIKNNKYDIVVIGGGQLIKTNTVFLYSLITWYYLCKNISTKMILYGVGADSSYKKTEIFLYEKILKKFDRICVRDNDTKEILENKFSIKCKDVIPDIVFTHELKYEINKKDDILVFIYDYDTAVHHFNINKTRDEYYDSYLKLLDKKNLYYNKKILYLAYTTIQDKIETYLFAEYLKKRNIRFEIINTDDLEKLECALANFKYVLSARMHALILGLVYQCDLVPYNISNKIRTFEKEYLLDNQNIIDLKKKIIIDTEKNLKWSDV